MRDHEQLMGMALEAAQQAYAVGEVPIGAVVVAADGQVLSTAHNAPIQQCDPTAHAEVLALREAARKAGNYRLTGCHLYVTLEPCVMCLGAVLQARIATLVFGAFDSKMGAAGGNVDLTNVPGFNHYVQIVSGVRAEESVQLLRRFFQERR